jgi:hypothetical protein
MVRHRFHFVPALGRFNEGVQWIKDLNAAQEAAGCTPGRLWAASFGPVNQCVLETDYDDIAAYAADQDRFGSSAEVMRVFRAGIAIGAPDHHPWDELLEEAPVLA